MITYHGERFDRIDEFNGIVLDLSKKSGGGLCVVFPISPADYREDKPTKAKAEVIRKDTETLFNITDDWGNVSTVIVTNDHEEDIQAAINGMIQNKLMEG